MLLPLASDALSITRDISMSVRQCYSNRRFKSTKYLQMRRIDLDNNFYKLSEMLKSSRSDNDSSAPVQKKKRAKRRILGRRTEEGDLEELPPTQSMWYHHYITCPQVNDTRFLRKFRLRFRLPYQSFLDFVDVSMEGTWFPRWMGSNCAGANASLLELLILGLLHYLGRGYTFDELEECTAISEEVHRVFFHQFIKIGSTILYEKYVITPTTKEEIAQHLPEFEISDFPGATASSDATPIIHEKCMNSLKRVHQGGKSKYATRAYNIIVNNRRRILGTTKGNPG